MTTGKKFGIGQIFSIAVLSIGSLCANAQTLPTRVPTTSTRPAATSTRPATSSSQPTTTSQPASRPAIREGVWLERIARGDEKVQAEAMAEIKKIGLIRDQKEIAFMLEALDRSNSLVTKRGIVSAIPYCDIPLSKCFALFSRLESGNGLIKDNIDNSWALTLERTLPTGTSAEAKAKAQASLDDLAPSLLKVKEFNRKLAAEIITRLEKTAVDDSALIPFYIENSERAELGAISKKRLQANVAAGKIPGQALDELKAKLLIVAENSGIFLGKNENELRNTGIRGAEVATVAQRIAEGPGKRSLMYAKLVEYCKTDLDLIAAALLKCAADPVMAANSDLTLAWQRCMRSEDYSTRSGEPPTDPNEAEVNKRIVDAAMKAPLPKDWNGPFALFLLRTQKDMTPYVNYIVTIQGSTTGPDYVGSQQALFGVLAAGGPAAAKVQDAVRLRLPRMEELFIEFSSDKSQNGAFYAELIRTGNSASRMKLLDRFTRFGANPPPMDNFTLAAITNACSDSDDKVALQALTILSRAMPESYEKISFRGVDITKQADVYAAYDAAVANPSIRAEFVRIALRFSNMYAVTAGTSLIKESGELKKLGWACAARNPDSLENPKLEQAWAAGVWDSDHSISEPASKYWSERHKNQLPAPPWYAMTLGITAIPLAIVLGLGAWGFWRNKTMPLVETSASEAMEMPAKFVRHVCQGLIGWQGLALAALLALVAFQSESWRWLPVFLLSGAMLMAGVVILIWLRRAMSTLALDVSIYAVMVGLTVIAMSIDLLVRSASLQRRGAESAKAMGLIHMLIEFALMAGLVGTLIWMLVAWSTARARLKAQSTPPVQGFTPSPLPASRNVPPARPPERAAGNAPPPNPGKRRPPPPPR